MKTVLLINGPNLNLLGSREPDIYGRTSLAEIQGTLAERAGVWGINLKPFQSNHEGALIDFIQAEQGQASGIIINPGALTHYSYALRDCLAGVGCPVIEVHISNLRAREHWRQESVMTEVCTGMISGLGVRGYLLALEYFRE